MKPKSNNKTTPKSILVTCIQIVIVALAYFIAGRLALLLAIPPGYLSPVWPAAGIGLAGVLLFGYCVCPGVFLGSLFITLFGSYDISTLETFYRSFGIASCIAFGSGLQAFLGAYLIKRFGYYPNSLEKQKDIICFLLLGAPVSCLVNATVGISTLVISGAAGYENIWFSWVNWWAGDVIGVLIFTPLILILYLNDALIWKRRRTTIVIPLCLFFTLVVLFFVKARSLEQQKINYEFFRTLKAISSSLEKEIDKNMDVLYSTKSLYGSSDRVTKDEFRKFVKRVVLQNSGIYAISWNPVIKNSYLSVFKEGFKRDGSDSFEINEINAEGLLEKAKTRKEYVVVTFIEPYVTAQILIVFRPKLNMYRYLI